MDDLNKKSLLLNSFLAQLFLTGFLVYAVLNHLFNGETMPGAAFLIILALLIALSFWMARQVLILFDRRLEVQGLKIKLEESEHLVTTMRLRHHDFLNHLQVISGLVQIKRYSDVVNYVNRLSQDLRQIENVIMLKRPDVAALLGSKLVTGTGIETSLVIDTDLAELSIPPEKLTSILGNLLDNALYETSLQADKWLGIEISEDSSWYFFKIENPGFIPTKIKEIIFERGFTTKGQKGSGMGLYIAKNLTEAYKGDITCYSDKEEGVVFTVKLPKSKKGIVYPIKKRPPVEERSLV